ncbi:MAG: TIGR00159 family protein [Ruminococcaceae bacterium]|nr:TIGR00159 family protein [Oscillospiraceae bacterium]
MELNFTELFASIGRYLISINITGYLDIAILAFVAYNILLLVQSTKAASLLKGLAVFFAIIMLSSLLKLHSIYFILSRVLEYGMVAFLVLFQPELRRILEQMGSRRFMRFFSHTESGTNLEQSIDQTVLACAEMSQSRTGALIVFEREMRLDDMIRSGTVLDAAVSSELLKNIFFVKAPMHDGAVIIRGGRVQGAGCMLPLSRNENLSRALGMRHRAGIGMSENSDAVVVIVSEETGSVSVAVGGMLKRHLKPETLGNLLRNELLPQDDLDEDKQKFSLLKLLRTKLNGGTSDGE